VKLAADLEADLGEVGAVICDPADLHDLFLCLLLNAARACAAVEGRGTVRVQTRAQGGFAVISVCDSAGADGRACLQPAQALIAEKHGGGIAQASRPEGGTAVTVRLPLAPERR